MMKSAPQARRVIRGAEARVSPALMFESLVRVLSYLAGSKQTARMQERSFLQLDVFANARGRGKR